MSASPRSKSRSCGSLATRCSKESALSKTSRKPSILGRSLPQEIRALKQRITELQGEMRTEFMKRDKLKAKLRKAEEELERRERQLDRMSARDLAAMKEIEAELGDWLGRALKETLSLEETDSFNVHELVQASQRLANRRWGSELGKLRRQTFEHYVQWIEKLKRSKDLVSFLQEVGRNIHHLRVQRKKLRSPYVPEAYDDLRQSGDIAHLLPSEASLLADEDFEPYFLVKWMENKLMTYNYTGSRLKSRRKVPSSACSIPPTRCEAASCGLRSCLRRPSPPSPS